MSDILESQRQALEEWADAAIVHGWLSAADKQALEDIVLASPAQLFTMEDRPLVAGFFGGTGVGKSTLLNRLAGEAVARTSAERPTSRDITVYVHRSMQVDKLPEELPLARMRTALHQNAAYQQLLWVDMPDFDSVETSHRELVNAWLPHLDVVLYVVSPDRYRDDQGWRLLLEHGNQHAWLFVFNHWDRGHPDQLNDFRELLKGAGLNDPMIFRTDCSTESPREDDFDALESTLQSLADSALIAALQQHGVFQRLANLKQVTDQWQAKLGSANTDSWQALWKSHWQSGAASVLAEGQWKIPAIASRHAGDDRGLLQRWRGRAKKATQPVRTSLDEIANSGETRAAQTDLAATLVDRAALNRIDESIERFGYQLANASAIPHAAIQHHLAPLQQSLPAELERLAAQELNAALAHPGKPWQRSLHRFLKLLSVLLPLAAMTWVGCRVVMSFVAAADDPTAYLGSNFAVNSVLLVALAWLLPMFLAHKTRPSTQQAAAIGLQHGVEKVNERVDERVRDALDAMGKEASRLDARYQDLWQAQSSTGLRFDENVPERLRRLLIGQLPPSLSGGGVAATVHSDISSAPAS